MTRKEYTFTLVKKVTTKKQELVLTGDSEEFPITNLSIFGKGSRVENWRKLLIPGREIKVIEEYRPDAPYPIIAFFRVKPDDILEWDSTPKEIPEWIPFWNEYRHDIEVEVWNQRQEASIKPDGLTIEETTLLSFSPIKKSHYTGSIREHQASFPF